MKKVGKFEGERFSKMWDVVVIKFICFVGEIFLILLDVGVVGFFVYDWLLLYCGGW